ncbi:metallopeptidase family protein [Parasphingopyxis lamellibrachiae]|uniref:Putative Zn-dependent protease with MMP-like domain n=1 Tax=Parasphingopyxis lamellibrachiae TaxID=680125 RepID=A0A3D9FI62_9SPHN|nr:metallopeptidase family protein [Parasphingopyxis lamellibrachiae]RED17480.1 putative Zn-dependent protease with MMP-like domain [Parasphingopyxis lamellibrachiae]
MRIDESFAARAPDADAMEAMARRSLDGLPLEFREQMGNVVLRVEEYADAESLNAVGLTHPMQLSGLYTGRPIETKSVSDFGTLPDIIHLYRQPILAEAAQRRISVEQLVHHVLIHEVGHHFGFSDADMHALEDSAD